MTADLERRLRGAFTSAELPAAPARLHDALAEIASAPRPARTRFPRRIGLLAVAAVLLVGSLAALSSGSSRPGPTPRPNTSTSPTGPVAMTVSEVLSARAAGGLKNGTVEVGGYWSDGSIMHSCAAPMGGQPGELEIYCMDGEWGITELDEPIVVIDQHGRMTRSNGPHLTPWVPNDLAGPLFRLPMINGQRYPPVPIVVRGHFDDSRASQCRLEARKLCQDRLVVDEILSFDPGSVPTPAPTPSPTPFPSPPPPALFQEKSCAGDVRYSFVGWTTTDALDLPFDRPGHVWAMVTAVPVPLGDWSEPVNGHRFRWFGQRICIAEEGEEGVIEFGHVHGSTYKQWDDGRKEQAEL